MMSLGLTAIVWLVTLATKWSEYTSFDRAWQTEAIGLAPFMR
jgi:hypothetical protein